MLGAIAGDIIASPYERSNASGRDFDMFASVKGRSDGHDATFHPKVTDATVMTLAVARWVAADPSHGRSGFITAMKEMFSRYPECGFSPAMKIWCRSEYARPFHRDCCDPASRISPIALGIGDLKEALDTARIAAEFTHTHPDSVRGAQALTEAIWRAAHGRSKDDIRFAMENDYGIDTSIHVRDLKSVLMGGVREDIVVNGEPTGEFYYRETGKVDHSTMNNLTAALKCFLEGEGFEDIVRRAVSLGGDSCTITSMAGALAQAFHKEVPDDIVRQCCRHIPDELKDMMESFEMSLTRKPRQEQAVKASTVSDLSFQIIKTPDGGRIFVTDPHRKELIAALKGRFGNDIRIIRPEKLEKTYRELCLQGKDGTYVERPRPEVRTLYFQDGEFRTAVTLEGETLPDRRDRIASRQLFCELSDFAREVKEELHRKVGYVGEGAIHFQNAYYPVIHHDRIEIFRGDILAGSVGIDPCCGLLRIDQGGDFGPMEWFGERTESVFSSISSDSIKDAIGRYCLDEGVGIHDMDRRLNIEVANDDVARSQDSELHKGLDMSMGMNEKSMKMSL